MGSGDRPITKFESTCKTGGNVGISTTTINNLGYNILTLYGQCETEFEATRMNIAVEQGIHTLCRWQRCCCRGQPYTTKRKNRCRHPRVSSHCNSGLNSSVIHKVLTCFCRQANLFLPHRHAFTLYGTIRYIDVCCKAQESLASSFLSTLDRLCAYDSIALASVSLHYKLITSK